MPFRTALAVLLLAAALAQAFDLHIVHLNDFHARFEEVSRTAGTCKVPAECVGGLPRVMTAVKAEQARDPDLVLLNAGDNYQGTLWYSLFRWNVTAHFMNEFKWDAMVIGNHEFDHGIEGLVPFMERFQYPLVLANVDDTDEPTFQGHNKPFIIIERGGQKIGIVGYIWKDTPTIASTGKLKFGDELEAMEEQGAILKQQGVNIILGLSHSGIEVDIEVAKKSKYVDVIVGGHSHTLLYTGTPPSGEKAYDLYPVEVKQTDSSPRTVLVVQASAYTKYLGNISVQFDADGEVVSWTGNPIYMETSIVQDPEMVAEMVPWKAEVEEKGKSVLGYTNVALDKLTHSCYRGECTLGNFVTDAMVEEYVGKGPEGSWTAAAVAFTNAGGLRTNIEPGVITYSDLVAAQPFENTLDLIEMQGRHILELLEEAVGSQTLLQWSGLKAEFDYSLPAGSRVVSAKIRCAKCSVPSYGPIDPDTWYTLVGPSFVLGGGDNFQVLLKNTKNHTIGRVDIDSFLDYLQRHNPVLTEESGRLKIDKAEKRDLSLRRRHPETLFNAL